MQFTRYLKKETFLLKWGGGWCVGGVISFTMMAFTWQDSFGMTNSNESVKLLFIIPVLLYKTSTDEISFPSIWTRWTSIGPHFEQIIAGVL